MQWQQVHHGLQKRKRVLTLAWSGRKIILFICQSAHLPNWAFLSSQQVGAKRNAWPYGKTAHLWPVVASRFCSYPAVQFDEEVSKLPVGTLADESVLAFALYLRDLE